MCGPREPRGAASAAVDRELAAPCGLFSFWPLLASSNAIPVNDLTIDLIKKGLRQFISFMLKFDLFTI